jgi:hypothetical protein
MIMKMRLSPAAFAIVWLGAANAALAQDQPTFERSGYPLTPHQLQVLGSDRVQEQEPSATLTQDGMPASPHQLTVLRHADPAAR